MNLMEETFQNKEEKKRKRITRIILVSIVLVILIIISIVAYLMYIQSTVLKLTLNGQSNEKFKNMLVFEQDGTIYVPIKEIATFFGYDSFNGEYSEKSEIQSKCYVQSQNEVANFELGQTKIYKLDLSKNDENYEYFYMKKPVKAINGVLYATTDGIERAFNISFNYEKEENKITILTMPYLQEYYRKKILDYGYTELSDAFGNQKALLDNKLIVKKDSKYGVINVDGTVILEPKYDDITYLRNTKDFLVKTNGKFGIISSNRETKVGIMYDSISLMDSDAGLYVAKQNNEYGVIDTKGNVIIYIENEQIGIDISKFTQNNIKNKYILLDKLIPVKKDNLWGLYDLKGNQIVEYKYDSLGYVTSNSRDSISLLTIPNYNVLVACKNKKYTLLNSSGEELFATVADDIYMTISEGEKYYYIIVNDKKINAQEYLDSIKGEVKNQTKNETSTTNNNESNNEEENQNNSNGENEYNNQEEQNNEEQNENNEEQNGENEEY